ncbi:MAG: rod shape-determining protein MreC [Desulfovibrionaceae bacterium]|nr:rod shape-determining protein MreC [Desulfovibrionaceae bacterium]
MTLKRAFALLVLGLFVYLGLYTWNERTGSLNSLAENTGLEIVGAILLPAEWVTSGISDTWSRYVDLVNVREERDILAERLENATAAINSLHEDRHELLRLRELMHFSEPKDWTAIGARVIGTRIGPQAALNSVILNKGFSDGALPGTPVVTRLGVVGQVLRSNPNFSTVLLVNDPSCRIAVISQETRFPGIIGGQGLGKPPMVYYVPPNAQVKIGEFLITSGLDGLFPKGIPVAWVEDARPSDTSPFQTVTAWPLASLSGLEEVLLLQPAAGRKENPFNRFVDDLPLLPEATPQSLTPALPLSSATHPAGGAPQAGPSPEQGE